MPSTSEVSQYINIPTFQAGLMQRGQGLKTNFLLIKSQDFYPHFQVLHDLSCS